MSGSCASVDELAETQSDSLDLPPLSVASLTTCAQPTCLVLHCLAFKIRGQSWPGSDPPLRLAPSMANPVYAAREQAQRARLDAVQEAQAHSQVQVSDVTPQLIDNLKHDWGSDSD